MRTHDFAAIGVGPFNLGLAALTADVPGLDGVFLEQRAAFDWHPGLMLEGVTIQVPLLDMIRISKIAAGASWVFDRPFFLILNVAVGGNFPGNPDATTVFPQSMQVDYVRVYKRADL